MADYKLNAETGHYRVDGSPVEFRVIRNLVDQQRGGQLGPVVVEAVGTAWGRSTATAVGALTARSADDAEAKEIEYPDVLVQAVVIKLGERTDDGALVEGVSVAWFEIIRELEKDPDFLFKVPWRKLEEIIAGAYEQDGWPEVILTPRSGDDGRDVIATRPGWGSVRIFDQVKAYARGYRVTADEVRSLLGTLAQHPNVSKGVVTTSAEFAPGIKDSGLSVFMPHRLELKDGVNLARWLKEIADRSRGG